MNNSFNYSNFIDMFLVTSDEFEPYGFTDDVPASADIRQRQHEPLQHQKNKTSDPGED